TTSSIGTISGTATTLVSIPSRSNTAFRGVAFAPENFALAAATLPNATPNVAYSQAITTGGAAPYTFTLGSGSPPAGLSFDPATGFLSGTPTGTGTATFSVTVTDATGLSQTRTFTLTVSSPVTVNSVTRDASSPTNAGTASWTVT